MKISTTDNDFTEICAIIDRSGLSAEDRAALKLKIEEYGDTKEEEGYDRGYDSGYDSGYAFAS